ncbi:MAG TPA: hypothetical protein PK728_05525 [Bacillota bacterium]|nr:hypothetical protein [Bacillota bacterium]
MAIKGVSDIRRLPRLGKIRLGEKEISQRTGAEYPKAVDYFVCPPEVQKVYGEKPRVLDIMFPVSDQNLFFPQWYKRYNQTTGLICKGDGETATMWQDGEMVEIECVPDECEWYAKKHCRRLANLQFLLPKVPGLGVWQIDTTSFYSIININSALDMIRAVADRIHMIPLQLVLKPQEVAPDGKKKTVYVLDLVAPVTLSKLLEDTRKTPQQLLMPALDENERPEDLYPDAVLNKPETKPFTLDAPPAPITQPGGKEKKKAAKTQKAVSEAEYRQIAEEGESFLDSYSKARDDIDTDLQTAFDILGVSPGKRMAILGKPGLDKPALLKHLQAEIDRRNQSEPRTSPVQTPPAMGAFF